MSKSKKRCSRCRETKPVDVFSPWKGSRDGRYTYCRPCARDYQKQWEQRNPERHSETIRRQYPRHRANMRALRLGALTHYSNGTPRCACCGDTHFEFLAIDHVNGDGSSHRKSVSTATLPRWLKNNGYPAGFQVLCHNCNAAKAYYGRCPHIVEV